MVSCNSSPYQLAQDYMLGMIISLSPHLLKRMMLKHWAQMLRWCDWLSNQVLILVLEWSVLFLLETQPALRYLLLSRIYLKHCQKKPFSSCCFSLSTTVFAMEEVPSL